MRWRSCGSLIAFLLFAVIGLLGGIPQPSFAQQGEPGKSLPGDQVISVEFTQLDIDKALIQIFSMTKGSYVMSKDVKGQVTISLRNVKMEVALANVLRQVDATWRIRDGVYEIVRKQDSPTEQSTDPSEKVDVRVALARLFGSTPFSISPDVQGMVNPDVEGLTFGAAVARILKQVNATCRVENGLYEVVPQAPQDPAKQVISYSVDTSDIRDVLRTLFKKVSISYSIDPDVQGTISVTLKDVTFEAALTHVLRQVDATYRVEGGVFQVIKNKIRMSGPDPSNNSILVRPIDQTTPVITQDDKHLFILKGDTLYKVSKSDLKTVAMRRLGE